MKLIVFLPLVIVSVVSADLYSIAVNVLGVDKLMKMEPSLSYNAIDSVQGVEKQNKFNETVRVAYSYLNGIPNSIPIEIQFEAVLTLAAKQDGPMQRLINKTRSQYELDHYSLKFFLQDTAQAMLDSASLYGFYKFAFFEEESYAMRRILKGKQVELARVFNLYDSHPISKQFSFEYVVNQLVNPNLKLFKCDSFIAKFKSAIEGKDGDDIFGKDFEMLTDLLFNWVLNDSALMQSIMGFLDESTPDVSFEFQFKESLFQHTSLHKYREYMDWLIGYLVYIRKADFNHIENTLKLLYGDIASTEWNFLLEVIFSKNLLKNTYWSLEGCNQQTFIDAVNEYISYILDMFKSKNLADVATNLILQLNLVNLVERTHVPLQYRDFSATEKLIRQISDVNGVNVDTINEKVLSIISDIGTEDVVVAMKEIEAFVKQNEWKTE